MEVVIVHPSLNFAGGGELVCLRLMKALRSRGYFVRLVTVERTDWTLLKRIFNEYCHPNKEFYLFSSLFNVRFNFLRDVTFLTLFLVELLFLRLIGRNVLIISACGEKILSVANLVYVNGFPLRYAWTLPITNVRRKVCSKLYDVLLKFMDIFFPSIIVANSEFNGEVIRKVGKRKAFVIHPPVDVSKFANYKVDQGRKNIVMVTARFLPNQGLEDIPLIVKRVNNAIFYIIGPCGDASKKYIDKLAELVRDLGVEDRIIFLVNRPFSELMNYISKAKIFLRTLPFEPFGMSVVESMAAGCVPVVPRCSGAWYDILERKQGVYGFSYSSIEEAAGIINMLLRDENLRSDVASRSYLRASNFDVSVFERKILAILSKIK